MQDSFTLSFFRLVFHLYTTIALFDSTNCNSCFIYVSMFAWKLMATLLYMSFITEIGDGWTTTLYAEKHKATMRKQHRLVKARDWSSCAAIRLGYLYHWQLAQCIQFVSQLLSVTIWISTFSSAVSQWMIWLVDITYGSRYKLQQDDQGILFIDNRYPKRMARILHSLQISNDM